MLTNSRNVVCYFQEKIYFFDRDQNFSLKLTFEILTKKIESSIKTSPIRFWPFLIFITLS